MLNRITKFFHTLYNFIFCLTMIYKGFKVNSSSKNKPVSFYELWRYCKQWEDGDL